MTLSTSSQVSTPKIPIIDLTDSITDITANLIHDSEHHQLPSDIFEKLVFQALNDLIDEFAQNPARYLKPHHQSEIDRIAEQYLES